MFEFLSVFNQFHFQGNSLGQYLLALLIIAISFFVLKIVKKVSINTLSRRKIIRQNEKEAIAGMISVASWPLYLLIGLRLSCLILDYGEQIVTFLNWLTVILVTYYLIRVLNSLVDYGVKKFSSTREKNGQATSASAIKLMGRIARMILWVVGFIIVLQNLGYNVSTLAAGLGIGGLAIAFALQNVLADVFASFSIYFDRPFEVGDFIIVGADMGTVQQIGIKSTRLKTLQGQELVISNKELTETRVHNYRKMDRRRITFGFGVEYGTSNEKLEKIPLLVKEIIDQLDLAEIDRVHFKEFGPYSLDYEVVYYINDSEYRAYMDLQQSINLALKAKFEQEKIVFAFPRQDIFLVK
jgi:small-conductance mechanosensitive channel